MFKALSAISTLQWALSVSLLAHGAVLAVRFVSPDAVARTFEDAPLEVILVNASSDERPELAQAIAQARLAGGGQAERGRATSPLPPSSQMRVAEHLQDAQRQEEQRRVDALKEKQNRMLAQIRRQLADYAKEDPLAPQTAEARKAREQKRQVLVKLLAEIEKRINEENARPKKRYISPATREAVYAMYYDTLRRRIEARGTAQFPTLGGRKLYGELTMVITINFDGQVLDTEIVDSSGQPALDQRAQAIVTSMRYDNFDAAMRQQADQIVVVSRFRFARDATLTTEMGN